MGYTLTGTDACVNVRVSLPAEADMITLQFERGNSKAKMILNSCRAYSLPLKHRLEGFKTRVTRAGKVSVK